MAVKAIRCMGRADGSATEHDGRYLVRADFDFADGRGKVWWSSDASKAMQFPDAVQAWSYWRKTSTARPLRPDGQPNRPLTAYNVSIENFPDA